VALQLSQPKFIRLPSVASLALPEVLPPARAVPAKKKMKKKKNAKRIAFGAKYFSLGLSLIIIKLIALKNRTFLRVSSIYILTLFLQ